MLKKVFTKDKKESLNQILEIYKNKWYCIISYIYFANLVINKAISLKNKKWENTSNDYTNSLSNSDIILPDWIAFRMYYKKYFWENLHNLNGTDFLLYFLKNIWEYNLILYWAHKNIIKKASENLENILDKKIFSYQDWYSDFDFSILKNLPKNKINILRLWLWTPLQEIWCQKNTKIIKKYNLIVLNQWWSFDFFWWKEKRAPLIIQKLKLEWLFRLITNPRKNFKKVFWSFYIFIYLIF